MNNSIRISTWIHEIEYGDLYQHLAPLNGTQRARRVRQLMRIGLAALLGEASAPAKGARAGQAAAENVALPGNPAKTATDTPTQAPSINEAFDEFGVEPQDFKFSKQDK